MKHTPEPRPSDEILMAFADRALAPDEMRRIEAMVSTDRQSHDLVLSFRRLSVRIDQAFADVDYRAGEDRFRHLILNHGRRSLLARWSSRIDMQWLMRRNSGVFPPAWPAGPVLAASVAFGVCFGAAPFLIEHLRPTIGVDQQLPQSLALGDIGRGSHLWSMLEGAQRGDASSDTRAGTTFRSAMRFVDRFGNACHEVDVEDAAGRTPAEIGVLVACQPERGRWTLIAAAQTRDPGRTNPKPYVTDVEAAHDAMAGILKMIGARQHSTALEKANAPR